MFFKLKKREKESMKDTNLEKKNNKDSKSKDANTEINIVNIEYLVQTETDIDKLGRHCYMAGMAYRDGVWQAVADESKAEYYFKLGIEKGSLDCKYALGELYVCHDYSENEGRWLEGIELLCECVEYGDNKAVEVLQVILESNALPGIETVSQLMKIYNKHRH